MTEVFVFSGETLDSVQQELKEFSGKISSENRSSSLSKISSNQNSLRDVGVEVVSYKNSVTGKLLASAESTVCMSPAESVRIVWFDIY